MKKDILHLATILLLGVGLLAVSCGKEDPGTTPEQLEPNFPTKVTPTIEAGDTYTLAIEPNASWEISIPTEGETSKWFWIQDGSQKTYTLRGNKGKHSVVIGTLKEHDFNKDQACEVTMKMKGRDGQNISQVVATIKIGKVVRTFTIHQSKLDEDSFVFNGNTEVVPALTYEYQEAPTTEITLMWPYSNAKGYSMPILVEGNFNWSVMGDLPEWLSDESVSSGTVDQKKEVYLLNDLTKLPKDGAEATIMFGDEKASFPLKVIIPAYTELFKSEFPVETLYNSNGEFYDTMNSHFVEGAAYGRIASAKSLKFIVFAEVTEGGNTKLSNSAAAVDWVKVSDKWNASSKDLAQNRRIEISAAANKGNARKAVVLGVPASIANTVSPDQMVNGNEIAENYRQYLVSTLKQLEYFGVITPKNLISEMKQSGALIEKLPADAQIIKDFKVTDNGYKLSYTDSGAAAASTLIFNKAYTKYECYDFNHQKMDPASSWLTVRKVAAMGEVIEMDKDKDPTAAASQAAGIAHQGYIVFSDAGGDFAVVECVYDELFTIPLDPPAFLYPTEAARDGSTLVKLTSGELFDKYQQPGIPVWHLTYTKQRPTMSAIANLPTYAVLEEPNWVLYSYSGAFSNILISDKLPVADTKKTGQIKLYSDNARKKLALILVVTNK